jgi:hypothetical protein
VRSEKDKVAVQDEAVTVRPFALLTSHFSLPKAGNAADEYEDAWASIPGGEEGASAPFRCAVADGATETSFSGLWARLLAEAYCTGADSPEALDAALPLAQRAWRDEVGAIPLPWYAEEKARKGAFAALAGLTIRPPAEGEAGGIWTALACGDSCLFQTRDGELIVAYPLAHSDDFTNRPVLLSSDPISNAGLGDALEYGGKDWLPGDRFYLATDALAAWFLAAFEAGDRPWHILDAFGGPDAGAEFAVWIADLRAARALRNDDVTLLCVRL